MMDAGEKVGLIRFDLHSPAAPIALLTPPEFAIYKTLIDLQTCRHAGQESDQGFSVRLP